MYYAIANFAEEFGNGKFNKHCVGFKSFFIIVVRNEYLKVLRRKLTFRYLCRYSNVVISLGFIKIYFAARNNFNILRVLKSEHIIDTICFFTTNTNQENQCKNNHFV